LTNLANSVKFWKRRDDCCAALLEASSCIQPSHPRFEIVRKSGNKNSIVFLAEYQDDKKPSNKEWGVGFNVFSEYVTNYEQFYWAVRFHHFSGAMVTYVGLSNKPDIFIPARDMNLSELDSLSEYFSSLESFKRDIPEVKEIYYNIRKSMINDPVIRLLSSAKIGRCNLKRVGKK
jgi:hypothetical protein